MTDFLVSVDSITKALPAAVVTANQGTSSGKLAAGNDSRITGAAQKASNLSDLANAATARTNLGLGDSATRGVGTSVGTVAAGDDARIVTAASPKVYYVETWDSLFGGASGAYPDARWQNVSHLTNAALATWAAHILTGSPIPATGAVKVVWFGDSWISQMPATITAATLAHNPTATAVISGVSGNKSADLIARFAADVPTDADYVIIDEPGVNDVYAKYTAQQVTTNLDSLVSLIRGIGAIPVVAGQVPLSEYLTRSRTVDLLLRAQASGVTEYPGVSLPALLDTLLRARSANSQALGIGSQGDLTGANCTAFGCYTQASLTTGNKNTAVGGLAQFSLTTGVSNTAIGAEAQYLMTTGNNNSAFGDGAQRAMTTGGNNAALGQGSQYGTTTGTGNTGVGTLAQFSLTTGINNTAIGRGATYDPAGVPANAHTTGSYSTCVGAQSGLGSATQVNYVTTIGYRTVATAAGGVAIGVDSGGASAAAVAANDFMLGTANHNVKVPGRLNVAQRTPTGSADASGVLGDIASDDNYIYAKTSTGWKRAALTAW